jgi:DNA-binding transcriptional ArsR family regulator
MSTGALDPLIHHPQRLRIVATLAALPDGDTLSFTRLQDMIGLTPGNLIIHLRELGHAGYVRTEMTSGRAQAAVALTRQGRAALDRYTAMLRHLPQAARQDHQAPAPGVRVGDADRDAAAAALGEHFAQGRLTLEELSARLDATLTATTRGELSQAAQDLPDLTMFSAQISFPEESGQDQGISPAGRQAKDHGNTIAAETRGRSSSAKTGSTRSLVGDTGRRRSMAGPRAWDRELIVHCAFSRADGLAMERRWWRELDDAHDIRPDDRSSWRQIPGDLKAAKRDPIQARILTERVRGVFNDLLGEAAWSPPRDRGRSLVTFPEPGAWEVPVRLWHRDNPCELHLDHPRALFVVSFIGSVGPRGGGTLILSGSPRLLIQQERRIPASQRRGSGARVRDMSDLAVVGAAGGSPSDHDRG